MVQVQVQGRDPAPVAEVAVVVAAQGGPALVPVAEMALDNLEDTRHTCSNHLSSPHCKTWSYRSCNRRCWYSSCSKHYRRIHLLV